MTPSPQWFCLKAQTKREHVAADHVRQIEGVKVFLPRIRFQRKTARGPVWFNEALFPGYLFAWFDFQSQFRQVHHAHGVRGVVHFGDRWPAIPAAAIAELQITLGAESLHVVSDAIDAGEKIEIVTGAFRGLKAVVTRTLPARERVQVLLEFLGRQTIAEIHVTQVVREGDQRRRAFRSG